MRRNYIGNNTLGCKPRQQRGLQPKFFLGGLHILHNNDAEYTWFAYKILNEKQGLCLQVLTNDF